MNIEKEREAFEAVWLVPHELGFFDFKDNQYVLKDNFADDSESPIANETYHSLNSGWSMWLKAKAGEAQKLEGCVVLPKSCQWTQDSELNWWTECGEGFVFNEYPHPNKHNFKNCCFCGGLLEAKAVAEG